MLGVHRLVLRVNAEYIVITICYISWRHTAGKRRRACEARIVVAQKMLKLLQNLAFLSQRDKNATIFAHRNQRERELAQSWIALFLITIKRCQKNLSGPANCLFKRQDVPFFRTFASAEIRGSSGD